MNISITGRHTEVTDALNARIEERVRGMLSEFPRVDGAHVILSVEKHRQMVEIVVHVPHHKQVEARAESRDMYVSLDEASEKIAVQLRRWADRVVEHKNEHLGKVDRELSQPPRE